MSKALHSNYRKGIDQIAKSISELDPTEAPPVPAEFQDAEFTGNLIFFLLDTAKLAQREFKQACQEGRVSDAAFCANICKAAWGCQSFAHDVTKTGLALSADNVIDLLGVLVGSGDNAVAVSERISDGLESKGWDKDFFDQALAIANDGEIQPVNQVLTA